ncbi:hypothetical protein LY76DRAFT_411518 [Colletotrichum caudatum]|nr:hypothetical protein LY76DRAFT_411518 [Colletotrichum caudatum]
MQRQPPLPIHRVDLPPAPSSDRSESLRVLSRSCETHDRPSGHTGRSAERGGPSLPSHSCRLMMREAGGSFIPEFGLRLFFFFFTFFFLHVSPCVPLSWSPAKVDKEQLHKDLTGGGHARTPTRLTRQI